MDIALWVFDRIYGLSKGKFIPYSNSIGKDDLNVLRSINPESDHEPCESMSDLKTIIISVNWVIFHARWSIVDDLITEVEWVLLL